MDSSIENKINILIQEMNDLRQLCKTNQSLMITQRGEEGKDLDIIKQQLTAMNHLLNKLEIKVELLSKNGRIKTSYKEYTPEEVYNIRYSNGMSLSKTAQMLNASKSTIQNMCKAYREQLIKEAEEESKNAVFDDMELDI